MELTQPVPQDLYKVQIALQQLAASTKELGKSLQETTGAYLAWRHVADTAGSGMQNALAVMMVAEELGFPLHPAPAKRAVRDETFKLRCVATPSRLSLEVARVVGAPLLPVLCFYVGEKSGRLATDKVSLPQSHGS